ncbi:MAG: nucleotidyl transferase AbiEii/AbiGii toxin family protein [Bacteroidota bacterium]
MKNSKASRKQESGTVDEIKKLALIAMVSDDSLMETLVLKGGNAIQLVLRINSRASKDLDFSIPADFEEPDVERTRARIEELLVTTFQESGYHVFDVEMEERPTTISPEMRDFWGGYRVVFKVISVADLGRLGGDIDSLRRNAVVVGDRNRRKFVIDISKYEFCVGKQAHDVDGYTVYVYTPEMLVFEKLRAICQQMPEYSALVKDRGATARARDFYDVHVLVGYYRVDFRSEENRRLLADIFKAKRVPLQLLGKVRDQREFHRPDFQSVQDTVPIGTELESFDVYFDYVLEKIGELQAFWEEQMPGG